VNHDIGLFRWDTRVLGHLLLSTGAFRIVHLHVILATFLALTLLLFVLTLGVLDVDLLAASLGLSVLVDGGAGSVFGASHGSILAFHGSSLFFFLLILFLLDAVLIAICGEVGLGLLWGELRRGRLLGIPITL
jgi:hypothetical protein